MNFAGIYIDAHHQGLGATDGYIESRAVASGLRPGAVFARDRVDGDATGRGDIVGKDIGALPAPGLFDGQFPGNGAIQVIGGISTAYRLVRVEYEIAPARASQKRAEGGRRFLRYRQGCERGIERHEQKGTKKNIPQSSEIAVRPRTHAQGVIG